MERYDDALADFTRAIQLDPEDAWYVTSRGETYRLMERYATGPGRLHPRHRTRPGLGYRRTR